MARVLNVWKSSVCYLGDMIAAGGGAGEASWARVRSGWAKFKELGGNSEKIIELSYDLS